MKRDYKHKAEEEGCTESSNEIEEKGKRRLHTRLRVFYRKKGIGQLLSLPSAMIAILMHFFLRIFSPLVVSVVLLILLVLGVVSAMQDKKAWDSDEGRIIPLISETVFSPLSDIILISSGTFVFVYLSAVAALLNNLIRNEGRVFKEGISFIDEKHLKPLVDKWKTEVSPTLKYKEQILEVADELYKCLLQLRKLQNRLRKQYLSIKRNGTWILFSCGVHFLGTAMYNLKDYGYYLHSSYAIDFFLFWYLFSTLWCIGDGAALNLFKGCSDGYNYYNLYRNLINEIVLIQNKDKDNITESLSNAELKGVVEHNGISSEPSVYPPTYSSYSSTIKTIDDGLQDITDMMEQYNSISSKPLTIQDVSKMFAVPPLPEFLSNFGSDDEWHFWETFADTSLHSDDSDGETKNHVIDRANVVDYMILAQIKKRTTLYKFRSVLCGMQLITCPAVGWIIGFIFARLDWINYKQGIDGVLDMMTIFQYINCFFILMYASTFGLDVTYNTRIQVIIKQAKALKQEKELI